MSLLCLNVLMLAPLSSQFLFPTGAGACLFPTEQLKAESEPGCSALLTAVSPYKFACKVYLSTSITQIELIN